ncbi:23S rRNA (guanosine(2251)-2'-O)-methyltransferase RlmB [Gilvimarinus chinensis]|uniref:23S rRNA (guanosine(2251)-2'-O)-methyltransferase RlmB n=1 Tax=Gilvimarinus chinensis TaxID=396005 RepID=UPI0003638BDC|nr:23S rRNA (guanosine(2251)-2'-O)-methyltransferase RlmB [Gilvimarinus chinensis]
MSKNDILYGLHAVQAILKSAPQRVLTLMVLQGRTDQKLQKILQLARQNGISVQEASRKKMDALAADANHQGVIAQARPGKTHDEAYLYELLDSLDYAPLLLVLDGVTDPHNLGACLRSADAAGVDAVIAPKDNAAGLNPTARKVACGAAEVVPFIPVTNLARTLEKLKARGVWVKGAAGEATATVFASDLTGAVALVMGAEGEGLRRLTRETCDELIKIPMVGTVSSLNVSVATGICLFEAVRQRSV